MSGLPPKKSSPAFSWEFATDSVLLLSVSLFLLNEFHPHLLLTPTVLTGGDTPSHFYTLLFLKNHLLPRGLLSGWTQGNLAGYPMLQNYFPLPFLIMVMISWFAPVTVAFKLGTILGTLLLPFGAYIAFRLMRLEFPAPILAAAGTLLFLFNESNSMWGGNIPSTLAGEFAYSLGLALMLGWMGTLYVGILEKKWLVFNAVLLACIGLCHGCTLLMAGALSLFFLFDRQRWFFHLVYLAEMYLLSFLLLSFWLIPLLAENKWTTPFTILWMFGSWQKEIFPLILWPAILLSIPAFFFKPRRPVFYLLTAELCAWFLYYTAPALNVSDIRFLPFTQIMWVLLAAIGVAYISRPLKGRYLIPLAVTLGILIWSMKNSQYISSWVTWNYGGFESKPLWPVYARLNDYLKGSSQDPRVVYENSTRHNQFGSMRAWESLPVFSGRSTLEHAYLQASPSSPFIFYIQSELSKEASCPFPEYACTTVNLSRAETHLKMFNVKDIIVLDNGLKALLQNNPDYHLETTVDPYQIYSLKGPFHYVEPLVNLPVLWEGNHWKESSYSWFRNDRLNDIPLVFPLHFQKEDFDLFPNRSNQLSMIPRVPLPPAGPVRWEKISDSEISFETPWLHRPHLIKMSYHPNWRVEGARKIYLVSPSFMLVYPDRPFVRLYFARGGFEHLGLTLTLIGLGLILGVFLRLQSPFTYKELTRAQTKVLQFSAILIIGSIGLYLGASAFQFRHNAPRPLLEEGIRFKDHERWEQAEQCFRNVISVSPVSGEAEQAYYFLAVMKYLQNQWEPAIQRFETLNVQFPNGHLEAESYFHIAACYDQLGRAKDRDRMCRALWRNFPQTQWAEFARQRWGRPRPSASAQNP